MGEMKRYDYLCILFLSVFLPSIYATDNLYPLIKKDMETMQALLRNLPGYSSTIYYDWNTTNPDPCLWQSLVRCSSYRFFSRVTGLNLGGLGLHTSTTNNSNFFFELLCRLDALETLDLSNNSFTTVPTSFYSNCTGLSGSLKVLDFSSNRLAGSIGNFSSFPMLEVLDLFFNTLEGQVSSQLDGLVRLRGLRLAHNHLNGSIPINPGLEGLDLHGNRFEGQIPVEITRLRKLAYLDISSNRLSGEVPAFLTKMENLTHIDLSNNQLSGALPRFPRRINVTVTGNINLTRSDDEMIGNTDIKQGKRKKKTTIIIVAGSAAMLGFLLVCLSLALYFYKHRKVSKSVIFQKKNLNNKQKIKAFLEVYESIIPRRYSYSDVKKITKAFQEKLGQGGYGTVFKGTLDNGHMVAVKILNDSKGDGEEFINEVASIGRTSHVNVVNLLGFCHEGSKRALIYDFMCNGSLEKLLYSEMPKTTFDWKKLYQIAIGIARGLEYLHRGCSTRIVHFDIKPHNILLDQDFCPKISDFGLAKLCLKKESIISIAGARGTIGYIAPEVFSRNFGVVSSKSDVYSYGMMVLEIAGGRKNPNEGVENSSEKYFPHWIYAQLDQNGNLLSSGVMAESEEIGRKMVLVGLWCIQTMPENRPSMSRVIEMLEGSVDDLQIPPKPHLSSSPFGSIVGTSSIEDICSIDCIDSSVHS